MSNLYCPIENFPGEAPRIYTVGTDENFYMCDRCLNEIPEGCGPQTHLSGKVYCDDCRETCDGNCGDYLSDQTCETFGPVIRFREAVSGRLRECHAWCAAEIVLLGHSNRYDDVQELSREQIAEIVGGAL